jgi:hypothetical protein
MLQSERAGEFEESLRLALKGQSLITFNSLVCIVTKVNIGEGTIEAQPAVQALVSTLDAKKQVVQNYVDMPILVDVPVMMLNAGNYMISMPVTIGDECLVIFSDRCIDNWWNLSGVQPQVTAQGIGELRFHDLSDGVAIIGPFSRPKVPVSISPNTLQIRTKDGATYLEIDGSGNCNIHANVNITGNLVVSGTTTGTADGRFNGIHVSAHRHTGVQTGGGVTGEPIDG